MTGPEAAREAARIYADLCALADPRFLIQAEPGPDQGLRLLTAGEHRNLVREASGRWVLTPLVKE